MLIVLWCTVEAIIFEALRASKTVIMHDYCGLKPELWQMFVQAQTSATVLFPHLPVLALTVATLALIPALSSQYLLQ